MPNNPMKDEIDKAIANFKPLTEYDLYRWDNEKHCFVEAGQFDHEKYLVELIYELLDLFMEALGYFETPMVTIEDFEQFREFIDRATAKLSSLKEPNV